MDLVTRVAIIDDDGVTRWALKAALSKADGIDVCATPALPDELAGIDVDAVVIVAHEPKYPDLKAWLDQLNGRTRALVVSDRDDLADVVAGLTDGVSGYLTTDVDHDVLVAAVQAVAAGGVCLTDRLGRALADAVSPRAPRRRAPDERLSPREREALLHIADGLTHSQAARAMGLSKATVDTYIERVRNKLGVNSKAALVRQAVELFGAPLSTTVNSRTDQDP